MYIDFLSPYELRFYNLLKESRFTGRHSEHIAYDRSRVTFSSPYLVCFRQLPSKRRLSRDYAGAVYQRYRGDQLDL